MQILIIGNGVVNSNIDFKRFDKIIGFNRIKNQRIIPFLTEQWLRYNGKNYAGENCLCKNIVLAEIDEGAEIRLEQMRKKHNDKTINLCCYLKSEYETWYDCSKNQYPSTGFMTVKFYKDNDLTLTGFDFKGCDLHNWDFEKRQLVMI